MATESVTYGQLYQLLARLEFVDVSGECPWKAYRHSDTHTLILLGNHRPELPARPTDLVSVKRHLADNGLLEPREFERLLC